MLDSWIIEELKRRENRGRREEQARRPVLELPIDNHRPRPKDNDKKRDDNADEPKRGVIIIDL